MVRPDFKALPAERHEVAHWLGEDRGCQLFDVRAAWELEEVRLEDVIHVDVGPLPSVRKEYLPDRPIDRRKAQNLEIPGEAGARLEALSDKAPVMIISHHTERAEAVAWWLRARRREERLHELSVTSIPGGYHELAFGRFHGARRL